MRTTLLIATMAGVMSGASPASAADCWILSNLKGQAQFESEGPGFVADGFGTREITLIFDGRRSNSVGGGLNYTQTSDHSMVGTESGAGWATLETWSVDPAAGRGYYTKAVTGSRAARTTNIDGVRAFVGNARRCN